MDQQLRDWLAESAIKNWPQLEVSLKDEQGKTPVIASGYELERSQEMMICDQSRQWSERVLLVHSPVYEQQQRRVRICYPPQSSPKEDFEATRTRP